MEEGGKWREMGKAAYTCTCRKHGRGERCKLHMYRGWMDGYIESEGKRKAGGEKGACSYGGCTWHS